MASKVEIMFLIVRLGGAGRYEISRTGSGDVSGFFILMVSPKIRKASRTRVGQEL